MAQMIISLRCDPATGKKDIVVKLQSDPDALPAEHEQLHRTLVDKLIAGGVIRAAEVGKVVVERQEDEALPAAQPDANTDVERRALGQVG